MNAVSIIGPEELSEGFLIERGCARIDTGRQCVHHELVFADDVHSLFVMRHSECAPALGVPLLQESVLDRIYKILQD
jgi:hypothetical protein